MKKGTGRSRQFLLPHPPPSIRVWDPSLTTTPAKAVTANNGRGKPDDTLTSLLFRLSVPGESEVGGPNPAAGFGLQLQTRATVGTESEAGVIIEYTEIPGEYGDGTKYSLRSTDIQNR